MGKFIVIEGTDCSGKETQSKLLVEKLNSLGKKAVRITFPNYDSPTGKIVGGPYLGKEEISPCWFPEPECRSPADPFHWKRSARARPFRCPGTRS